MVRRDSYPMIVTSASAAESHSPRRSFEWAPVVAFLIGALLGLGGSLVAAPQPRVAMPPRVAVPTPIPATAVTPPAPPEEAELIIPAKKSGTMSASAKSRLRVERRHLPAVPRVEPVAVDREHDFSFLPTGIEPPKERLKPLPF